jgi:hypothetical protein
MATEGPGPTLAKQRRDALLFETVCWVLALGGPAIAAWLLRDRMPQIFASAAYMIAPIIPSVLLLGAAIGFRRLRKGIERRMAGRS